MIKQGEVAFVKTTGEAVFVLSFKDPSPKLGDKDFLAVVRRPIAGQDGVRHEINEFFTGELETIDQQRDRMVAEQMKIAEKYGPKAQTDTFNPNTGFPSN